VDGERLDVDDYDMEGTWGEKRPSYMYLGTFLLGESRGPTPGDLPSED
jgi:hypothetical protein